MRLNLLHVQNLIGVMVGVYEYLSHALMAAYHMIMLIFKFSNWYIPITLHHPQQSGE